MTWVLPEHLGRARPRNLYILTNITAYRGQTGVSVTAATEFLLSYTDLLVSGTVRLVSGTDLLVSDTV